MPAEAAEPVVQVQLLSACSATAEGEPKCDVPQDTSYRNGSGSTVVSLATPPSPPSSNAEDEEQEHVAAKVRVEAPKPLWPSLVAGAVQAVLFNPVDRALFLRVHNRQRSLFRWSLWDRPFQGFANAAVYRTVSGATYLYFQDWFRWCFAPGGALPLPTDNRFLLQAAVGTAAGAANGWFLNGFQLVKFRIWTCETGQTTFLHAARQIYEVGGWRMFFRGAGVSMMRDVSFGVAYEVLRTPGLTAGDAQLQFCCNVAAGCAACVVSSPLNYCRNLVFGSAIRSSPLQVSMLLQFLWTECKMYGESNKHDPLARWHHMNARLNLGWGSVRVGLGIALGQFIYLKTARYLAAHREPHHQHQHAAAAAAAVDGKQKEAG